MSRNGDWEDRIKNVLSCPDNEMIRRVSDTRKIKSGKQIMHNFIKIILSSYYDQELKQMVPVIKGIPLPRKDYAFQLLLYYLKLQNISQYTMKELGLFWALYLMRFRIYFANSMNYLVGPDPFNSTCAPRNFSNNQFESRFMNGFVSESKKSGC